MRNLAADLEVELLELFLDLHDFIEDTTLRGKHLRTEHVTIYVRRSVRALGENSFGAMLEGRNCLDIADINVAEVAQGQGIFRRFMEYACHVSPYRYIMLECVNNQILVDYAERHGWSKHDDSYWKELRTRKQEPCSITQLYEGSAFYETGCGMGFVLDGNPANLSHCPCCHQPVKLGEKE